MSEANLVGTTVPLKWLYFKLCVGNRIDGLDSVVCETIPKVVQAFEFERWFFIRFIDEDGLHLRMRVAGDPQLIDRATRPVHAICDRGLGRLATAAPSEYSPLLSFAGSGVAGETAEGGAGTKLTTYEPELERYGGSAGVQVAEKLFQASSEMAVDILQFELEGGVSRKTLAPCLMSIVLDTVPLTRRPVDFLREYSGFWLAGGMLSNEMREQLGIEFAEKRQELQEAGVEIVAPLSGLPERSRESLGRWRGVLREAVEAFRSLGNQTTPEFLDRSLAFNFLHLMNNRLGIAPVEEAYLAALLEGEYAAS